MVKIIPIKYKPMLFKRQWNTTRDRVRQKQNSENVYRAFKIAKNCEIRMDKIYHRSLNLKNAMNF